MYIEEYNIRLVMRRLLARFDYQGVLIQMKAAQIELDGQAPTLFAIKKFVDALATTIINRFIAYPRGSYGMSKDGFRAGFDGPRSLQGPRITLSYDIGGKTKVFCTEPL